MLNNLQEIIDRSSRIVFFGGAGVSTESGIPDFRSADGLYSKKYDVPPEEMLSYDYFMGHTEEFFRFYREKMICTWAKPNAAHLKLSELERAGRLAAAITQNIDGLHQAAGSRSVYELHGSVHRNYCMNCGQAFGLDFIIMSEGVPRCTCGGIVKPDVVLYGEQLDSVTIENSIKKLSEADTLIVGGTSLTVYPAAGFIHYFRGNDLVLINRDETPLDKKAGLVLRENVGHILGAVKV
jgi:NAD-dependent deacetylase